MSEEKQVGFVTMGDQRAGEDAIPEIGIGMLGYAFMGRAHSNALKKIAYVTWPPPYIPKLVSIAGRNEEAVREAARRYGYEKYTTNWEDVVSDPDVQIFDNGGPNDTHLEPTVAAAKAGKHVICEKPLGRDAEESYEIWRQVAATGVKHMTAFNYRFYPAIILAKQLIEAGEIGEIYHFRARYHQEWVMDPEFPKVWRLDKKQAGSGALGDLGAHIIDLAQFVTGQQLTGVSAAMTTFVPRRPLPSASSGLVASGAAGESGDVTVDDAAAFVARTDGGALATFEATRFATGRKNAMGIELNGSGGSLAFDFEAMNELYYYDVTAPAVEAGFRRILVTEPDHPYVGAWWPPGHILGYEHTFTHEVVDLVHDIAAGRDPSPSFADGAGVQRVLDAVESSAENESRWTPVPTS